MDTIRIQTLMENLVYGTGLTAEHGLSVYVEHTHDEKTDRILFDLGQTNRFIHNAQVLHVNISNVQQCVISHGHYDHTGGLESFLEINSEATVYLSKHAFAAKHGSLRTAVPRFLGITYKGKPLAEIPAGMENRFSTIDKLTQINETSYLFPAASLVYTNDAHFGDLTVIRNRKLVSDDFRDELVLVLCHNKELIILSGCSHRGISNIIHGVVQHFQMPVALLLGGFHLASEDERSIKEIAQRLNEYKIKQIGVSHCTGVETYALLKKYIKTDVFYNYTGNIINL